MSKKRQGEINREKLEDFAASAAPKYSVQDQIIDAIKVSIKNKGMDIKKFAENGICSSSDANKLFRGRADLLTVDMVLLIVQNIVKNDKILKRVKLELGELLDESILKPFVYIEEDSWQYLSQVMPVDRMISLYEIQEIAIKKNEKKEVICKIREIILSNLTVSKQIQS